MKKIGKFILLLLVLAGIWYVGYELHSTNHINHNNVQLQIKNKYFGVNIAGPEFAQPMYTDSKYTSYQYFNKKGLTLIRIPFTWERLQPTLQGDLDANQLISYTNMIYAAQSSGEKIIIEAHNFGLYNNAALTDNDLQNFSDLWAKITQKFSNGYSGIWGYELMNEPHDLPGNCQTWKSLSQAAINAIRQKDTTDWQSASDCLKDLTDPSNKLIYSAHIYFDEDKSGVYNSSCTDTDIGVKRAQPFLAWLAKNNKIGMFTEYGIPQDSCWQKTLDNFMTTIYNNPNIIGGTYWAAGPAWGGYALSVEPENGKDKPQMKILEKYPTTK